MSTTRTLSTRVNEKVYNSLIDYANEEGQTISQVIHQLVDQLIQLNKDMKECEKNGSLECSIESDTEKTPIATAKFEQDSAMKKLLEELQDKNIRIKNEQAQNIKLQGWLDEIKDDIENLKTSFNKKADEDRMKKGMSCFENSNF